MGLALAAVELRKRLEVELVLGLIPSEPINGDGSAILARARDVRRGCR